MIDFQRRIHLCILIKIFRYYHLLSLYLLSFFFLRDLLHVLNYTITSFHNYRVKANALTNSLVYAEKLL